MVKFVCHVNRGGRGRANPSPCSHECALGWAGSGRDWAVLVHFETRLVRHAHDSSAGSKAGAD